MSAIRVTGFDGANIERSLYPGDIIAQGEAIVAGALTTVGAGGWTGALVATGIITRTGPVGAYTDTIDTAQNILTALAGNANAANMVPGTTFRLTFINTVAFAMTLAASRGITLGTNGSGVVNCAASLVREYLCTVLNASTEVTLNCNTTNASPVVTFVLPPNMTALPMGAADNPQGIAITPGMIVTGTGVTAGTTVIGVTQGQGGVTGVTLSANATATSAVGGVSLQFSPNIRIDGVRSGTL